MSKAYNFVVKHDPLGNFRNGAEFAQSDLVFGAYMSSWPLGMKFERNGNEYTIIERTDGVKGNAIGVNGKEYRPVKTGPTRTETPLP